MSQNRVRPRGACVAALTLTATGCLPYASFQSAHLTEPGTRDLTVAVSRSQEPHSGGDDGWTTVDAIVRGPIGSRADWGVRFSVSGTQGSSSLVFGGDIRTAAVPDYLAIAIPVYIPVSSPSVVFFAPGLIASLPLGPWFEINAAAKVFLLREQNELFSAYNLGMAVGRRGGFVLRPEIGWLVAGADDVAVQVGVGIGLPSEPLQNPGSGRPGRGTRP